MNRGLMIKKRSTFDTLLKVNQIILLLVRIKSKRWNKERPVRLGAGRVGRWVVYIGGPLHGVLRPGAPKCVVACADLACMSVLVWPIEARSLKSVCMFDKSMLLIEDWRTATQTGLSF